LFKKNKKRKLESNSFINLLENKTQIEQVATAELKLIVEEFPYFQSARAMYLEGLNNQGSFKYNKELKTTAAYTTDRAILFDFITSKEFKNSKEKIQQTLIEKKSKEKQTSNREETETILKPTEKIEEVLEVDKPLPFSESENYSFNQWLQLSSKKPILRKVTQENLKDKIDDAVGIIEKFIQNNPKIKPLVKDKNISISVAKNKQDSSLMTETLAKVYLAQKKYENAIQAYRILILKYPEKSGFFADQIKRVQILQKNKS
jgi:tetratricopeptide (TPR) repeat protein